MYIRQISVLLLIVAVLSMAVYVIAEEILTNETVVKMASAKLGDTLIIGKIKSSKTNFDLSTDAIIKLKEAGVSEKIIEAMMGAVEQTASKERNFDVAPSQALLAGDFFLLQNGKGIVIDEHLGAQKLSFAKALFTMGGVADLTAIVKGKEASKRFSVSTERSIFISKIKVDEQLMQGGYLVKMGAARNYRFVKFTQSSGGSSAIEKGNKVRCDVKKNNDGTYSITTESPLSSGEYAFITISLNNQSASFYDFGIDENGDTTNKPSTGEK